MNRLSKMAANATARDVSRDEISVADGNGGYTQMEKWFIVTGSLVCLSVVLGIIYFIITHKNCVGQLCNGLRPELDSERCRRQPLPETDDLESSQSQPRLSTHVFVNKWLSRTRSGDGEKGSYG